MTMAMMDDSHLQPTPKASQPIFVIVMMMMMWWWWWLTSAVNSKSLSTNICGSLFTHWKANITGFLVIGMLQDGILIKLQVLEDIYCRTSFRLLDTLRWGWVGKGALSKTKLNFWLKILSIIALWTQILFSRSGFSSQWWWWRWCNTYWSGQRQALWR